jgi:hypothetical protein
LRAPRSPSVPPTVASAAQSASSSCASHRSVLLLDVVSCARRCDSRLTLPQESPANTADPTTFASHAPKPHPVARLAQAQTQISPLHASNPQLPIQPATAWEPHQPYPSRTASAIASGVIAAAGQGTAPAPQWPAGDPAEPPPASTAYERLPNLSQDWALVPAQPEHGAYAQHHVSLDHYSHPTAQLPAYQRPLPKKKTAKVPSSFVERQEKLKVSKRKGPLQEKLREKTHNMRRSKRICVRCRFYKSGVCARVIYGLA